MNPNTQATDSQEWRSSTFTWMAPAKLNLFLHITGRRADGYHNLQSIFQFISIYDELFFDINDSGQIHRQNDITGVPEADDLIIRAARQLQKHSRCSKGANIGIHKNLPMGGGLGGGSSDAATTLIALNKLWDTQVPLAELAQIGLQLGADVPIFIHGQAAWAEGVGEILQPVTIDTPWYVVIKPPVHVDTGKIFSSQQLTRDKHPIKIRDFLDGDTENVCQPLVEQLYPPVKQAIDWLKAYAPTRMTGTGACVFGRFESEEQAKACMAQLPSGWQAWLAKGLNQTPLYEMFHNS